MVDSEFNSSEKRYQQRKKKNKKCTLEAKLPRIFENSRILNIPDHSLSYFDEEQNQLVFEPPVYKQRYQIIFEILLNVKWRRKIKTITEYGCGNFKLLQFFKHFLSLRKINFVDIDAGVMKSNLGNLHSLDFHYWTRRINPLRADVFEGSISDPDSRILDSDVVIGVEIIEHLYPDTLEAVPYVIFNSVRPKIVIFTTPNADFNEAFPKFEKFRHPDHKFEWTREQFESWSTNIVLRFPDYKVEFFGVGKYPDSARSRILGSCSQLALFVRKDVIDNKYRWYPPGCFCTAECITYTCINCNPLQPYGICTYLTASKKFEATDGSNLEFYAKIESVNYPYRDDDDRTDEEKLLGIMVSNMNYQIPILYVGRYIAIEKITGTYHYGKLISEEEAEYILRQAGFQIEEHPMSEVITPNVLVMKRCVWHMPNSEVIS